MQALRILPLPEAEKWYGEEAGPVPLRPDDVASTKDGMKNHIGVTTGAAKAVVMFILQGGGNLGHLHSHLELQKDMSGHMGNEMQPAAMATMALHPTSSSGR